MSHFFYDTIIQRHLCRNINSCMSCLVFSFNTVFIQPNHQTLFELIWTGWHDHCQVPLWGRLEGRGVQREARWMRGCHRHCHHCHYHYQHCRHPWKWSQMITDFGAFFLYWLISWSGVRLQWPGWLHCRLVTLIIAFHDDDHNAHGGEDEKMIKISIFRGVFVWDRMDGSWLSTSRLSGDKNLSQISIITTTSSSTNF